MELWPLRVSRAYFPAVLWLLVNSMKSVQAAGPLDRLHNTKRYAPRSGIAALKWEEASQVTSFTSGHNKKDIFVITYVVTPRSPCVLCDEVSGYPSVKVTAKATEQGHCQTLTISCPVSQQLLCPRAWQPLPGICLLGRKWRDAAYACVGFP